MMQRKQSWTGTIPLLIILVCSFAGIFVGGFVITFYYTKSILPLWGSILLSVIGGIIGFGLFLNIPIRRRKEDPAKDLKDHNQIAEGAWCNVYRKKDDPKTVIKQLYFCGWGHNDYTKHEAFVIGKEKICGKWNPLVLWFLHYYMILYQLIGLKRRKRFEHVIEALPATYNVSNAKLRYEQTFVPHELTEENCPSDIREQFQQLNDELEACGLYLDDVHARNVRLTDNGRVRIVDGELYSGGEEWFKSKLVVLFNGDMVSSMEKVLGNERIVAWVDHRTSVDDIVKRCNMNH